MFLVHNFEKEEFNFKALIDEDKLQKKYEDIAYEEIKRFAGDEGERLVNILRANLFEKAAVEN